MTTSSKFVLVMSIIALLMYPVTAASKLGCCLLILQSLLTISLFMKSLELYKLQSLKLELKRPLGSAYLLSAVYVAHHRWWNYFRRLHYQVQYLAQLMIFFWCHQTTYKLLISSHITRMTLPAVNSIQGIDLFSLNFAVSLTSVVGLSIIFFQRMI